MAIRYALSHLVENANRSSGPLSPILEKYKHLIDPHLYKKVVEGQCWLMPPRTFKKRLFQWVGGLHSYCIYLGTKFN